MLELLDNIIKQLVAEQLKGEEKSPRSIWNFLHAESQMRELFSHEEVYSL